MGGGIPKGLLIQHSSSARHAVWREPRINGPASKLPVECVQPRRLPSLGRAGGGGGLCLPIPLPHQHSCFFHSYC